MLTKSSESGKQKSRRFWESNVDKLAFWYRVCLSWVCLYVHGLLGGCGAASGLGHLWNAGEMSRLPYGIFGNTRYLRLANRNDP